MRSGCLDNNGVNNMKKVIILTLLILSACILSACSKNENTEKYIYETTAYQYINDPNHKELQTKCEDKEQIEIAKRIIKNSEKHLKQAYRKRLIMILELAQLIVQMNLF